MQAKLGWVALGLALAAAGCDGGSTIDVAESTGGSASHQGGYGASGGASGNGVGGTSGEEAVDFSQPVAPEVFEPSEGGGATPRTDGSRSDVLPRPRCPEVEPEPGADCEEDELECSYGDSTNWDCRRIYECAGVWERTSEGDCSEPSAGCPAEPAPGEVCEVGADSERGYDVCTYGPLICNCCGAGRCIIDGWMCVTPPEDLDCPLVAPNIGDGCEKQAARCIYGTPCFGSAIILFCRAGEWEEESYGCLTSGR